MKQFLSFVTMAGLAVVLAAPGGAQAAGWPDEEKVITVVVPFSAGGGTDAVFRSLVEEAKKNLKARVAISNIDGAGSAKGTNEVLSLPADGYTLLASGTHTIGVTMQGLTAGTKELEHIVSLNWDPFIVAVLKSRPYKSMKDLVAAAKAKPGSVCLGNAGMGGATGIASVAINLKFDKAFNVTPFKGGNDLRADVLGGRCEVGIFSQSEIVSNQDAFQPLVILYKEHSAIPALKDVPTMGETGFGDLAAPGGSFRSISVKKGTPAEAKKVIAEAFEKAFNSPAYKEFMAKNGLIPAFNKLGQTDAYFAELFKGFEPILKEAGLYKMK